MPAFCRAVLIAVTLIAATAAHAKQTKRYWPGPVLTAEAKSRALCESVPNRIFVATKAGSECVAYVVTKGNESRRQAVLFFNGDAPQLPDAATFDSLMRENLASVEKVMQHWADKLHVRYVYVARLGLQGSSGDHRRRRQPHETAIMGVVTKTLMQRLGLDSVALAGQSGGSTIAAALLEMKQPGIACAVLGSGAFSLTDLEYANRTKKGARVNKAALARTMYDPSKHVAEIAADPARRIFVVGDAQDQKAAFPQQADFAASLKAAGHHAELLQVGAAAPDHHSTARYTLPTAGACLNRLPDDKIARAVANMQPKPPAAEQATLAVGQVQ